MSANDVGLVACCLPMFVVAIVLVATGVVSVGWLVVVLACTAIVAPMMREMRHGDGAM